MQAGKALEQLVGIIQEHRKDNPNVKVIRNAKLINRSGNTREIDVLVQGKWNGEDMSIAFECKDYTRKITEQTIDAFVTKIRELPQINKGIIVTTTGYTKGAQKEAEAHKIELYLINDIPIDKIIPTQNVQSAKVLCIPQMNDLKVHYIADEDTVCFDPEAKFRFKDNGEEIYLFKEICEALYKTRMLCELAAKYMEIGQKSYITGLKITPNRPLYIEDVRGKKYDIDYFEVSAQVTVFIEDCQIASQKKFATLTHDNAVSVSEYKSSMSDNAWVLVESQKEKSSCFIKDSQGIYYKPNIEITGQKR